MELSPEAFEDQMAHLVFYLAWDEAGYVNGAVFVLDGGATGGRSRP